MNSSAVSVKQTDTRCFLRRCLIALVISILPILMLVHPVSANNHDVQDDAGIINQATQDYIKQVNDNQMAKIKGHPQIAVMTTQSLDDLPMKYDFVDTSDLDEAAQEIFNHYRLGTKGYDNGVLLLVSVDDHKVRMQTGYGVESVLPDNYVNTIFSDPEKADFRRGDYSVGIKSMVQKTADRLTDQASNIRTKSDINQHQAAIERQQQIEKQKNQQFINNLKAAGIVIMISSACAFAGMIIYIAYRQYSQQKKINDAIMSAENDVNHELTNQSVPMVATFKEAKEYLPQISELPIFEPGGAELSLIDVTESATYLLNVITLLKIAADSQQTRIKDWLDQFKIKRQTDGTVSIDALLQDITGLSEQALSRPLADYQKRASRIKQYFAVTKALDDEQILTQTIQKANDTWLNNLRPQLENNQDYLKLDTDEIDKILDGESQRLKQVAINNLTVGSSISDDRDEIFDLLDEQLDDDKLIDSIVNQRAKVCAQNLFDDAAAKLDRKVEQLERKKVNDEFEQKLKKYHLNKSLDNHQQKFIDGLSYNQKKDLLSQGSNFKQAFKSAMAVAVGAMIAAEAAKAINSHAERHHYDDYGSHWRDDDDHNDHWFGGGSGFGGGWSSGSSWSDDSSWSGGSFGGDSGGWSDGGSFGGDGGFSGGGGGDAGW